MFLKTFCSCICKTDYHFILELAVNGINDIRESKTEKELVYVFTVVSEEDLPIPPEEATYIELFAKD